MYKISGHNMKAMKLLWLAYAANASRSPPRKMIKKWLEATKKKNEKGNGKKGRWWTDIDRSEHSREEN